jgi:hypothetical protein
MIIVIFLENLLYLKKYFFENLVLNLVQFDEKKIILLEIMLFSILKNIENLLLKLILKNEKKIIFYENN